MRQQFYNFAHRVLPNDVHHEPSLWGIISSDKAASYLDMRWQEAAVGTDAHPSKGLMWFEPIQVSGATVRIIRMPPPENTAEAFYAAIALAADRTLRYFVAERGASGNAFLAEWRPGARVRGGNLDINRTHPGVPEITATAPAANPWEIDSGAMPGMPYLASFVQAIGEELAPRAAGPVGQGMGFASAPPPAGFGPPQMGPGQQPYPGFHPGQHYPLQRRAAPQRPWLPWVIGGGALLAFGLFGLLMFIRQSGLRSSAYEGSRPAAATAAAETRATATASAATVAGTSEAKRDDGVRWRVPAEGPTRGPSTALVTIVEFGDFECPFTAKVEPVLVRLKATYKDDLRIVWKNLPLPGHTHALAAAELALEARAEKGDDGFWDAHDRLIASQKELDDAAFDRISTAVGLRSVATNAAIKTSKYDRDIKKDQELAKSLAATGTPTFFVNGRKVVGASPDALEHAVSEAFTAANARVAGGTWRAGLYDELMEAATAPSSLGSAASTK